VSGFWGRGVDWFVCFGGGGGGGPLAAVQMHWVVASVGWQLQALHM